MTRALVWRCLTFAVLVCLVCLPIKQWAHASPLQQPQPDPPERAPLPPNVARAQAHPNRIMVKFKPSVSVAALGNALQQERLDKVRDLPLVGADLVVVRDRSPQDAVKALQQRPDVEYASLDYVRQPLADTDEPRFPDLWGLHNTGQTINNLRGTVDVDMNVPEAWTVTKGDPNLVVAVIDDGVDFSHPDLAGHAWVNPGEFGNDVNGNNKAANGVDDDAPPSCKMVSPSRCTSAL